MWLLELMTGMAFLSGLGATVSGLFGLIFGTQITFRSKISGEYITHTWYEALGFGILSFAIGKECQDRRLERILNARWGT